MRYSILVIQFFLFLPSFGQLGEGIVRVAFDNTTHIDFYADTLDNKPDKQIQFFLDETINSYNIKNLNTVKE